MSGLQLYLDAGSVLRTVIEEGKGLRDGLVIKKWQPLRNLFLCIMKCIFSNLLICHSTFVGISKNKLFAEALAPVYVVIVTNESEKHWILDNSVFESLLQT
jgi:hypothetical protein